MPHIKGARVFHEDRLVMRWLNKDRTAHSWGKRVGADCPLNKAERRVYVQSGAISVIKFMMDHRKIKLTEAFGLLEQARGKVKRG